jgi:outer membrane protein TolC
MPWRVIARIHNVKPKCISVTFRQARLFSQTKIRRKEATDEANKDFSAGSITLSDVANEMILLAKIDVRVLQAKHANIRKALRVMAGQKDIDIESAIKSLMEMKARASQRRANKPQHSSEESA